MTDLEHAARELRDFIDRHADGVDAADYWHDRLDEVIALAAEVTVRS